MSGDSSQRVAKQRPDLRDFRIPVHGHTHPRNGGALSADATSGGSGGGGGSSPTGIEVTDGSTTVSPASVVDFTSGAVVSDLGGGIAGVAISGGSGSVPWSYAQADGGLVGDGVTDDTAAFQAWIDTVTASGTQSGWFFFEPGVYLIAGALQSTGTYNAQILLPIRSLAADQIVLTFQGVSRPGFEYFGPTGPEGENFSIIKSNMTGKTGTAACISGSDNGAVGSAHWNNIATVWENLLFEAPDDPTFTMLNLRQTQGGALRNVQISTTGGFAQTPVLPTHSNAYGVKMPEIGTSNYTEAAGLSVGGFYTCVRDGELVTYTGLILGICVVCLEIPHVAFPSTIVTATFVYYNYGIRATGSASPINILSLSCAHADSGSFVTTYDLDDPSNYLSGNIRHYVLNNTTAAVEPFTKNGGTGVQAWDMTKLGPPSGVTAATYGDAAHVAQVAVDVFGRVTSASSVAITATGAAHYLVIASSHSTPLIFGDLVQTSAGDDLIYTT